jgi:hypothetical protein
MRNYDTENWEPVRLDFKGDHDTVHYVLRELCATACQMARKEENVAVVAHAARWSSALFAIEGDIKGQEYSEGTGELHEGLYDSIRSMSP